MKKLSQKAVNEIMGKLDYFEARWQDEKEYEDWNDYIIASKKLVEKKGLKFIKLLKKPFTLVSESTNYQYRFKVTAKGMFAEAKPIL